jgi:hypothetical protein
LPVERVARVKSEDDKQPDDTASPLAPTPKGELSRGGDAARAKPSR